MRNLGRFLQFELWKACNHGCQMCYNTGIPHVRDQLDSLDQVLGILRSTTEHYDTISLIGGEFFDGQLNHQMVNEQWYELIGHLATRIKQDKVNRIILCTSLLYEDRTELEKTLRFLHSLHVTERVVIGTSYDSLYRFNPETLHNWKENIIWLHNQFPEIHLGVSIVMTQAFIDEYMRGDIGIKAFEHLWECEVEFNVPGKYFARYADKTEMDKDLPNFFPKRESFNTFLAKVAATNDFDLRLLLNRNEYSTNLYFTLDDQNWLELPEEHERQHAGHACVKPGPCKRVCCGYIDSAVPMCDDVEAFLRMQE